MRRCSTRRHGPGLVPARRGRIDARRTERDADHPRVERPLAAGAHRDVAAGHEHPVSASTSRLAGCAHDLAPAPRADTCALVRWPELVDAWGCWAPSLTADGLHMAYVSDRGGHPELWVQPTNHGQRTATTSSLERRPGPRRSAGRRTESGWPCSVATGGGVRSEVWVVRPDGSDGAGRGGRPEHAVLGPWSRRGHRLVITVCGDAQPTRTTDSLLFNPATGEREDARGGAAPRGPRLLRRRTVPLLRDGTRGAHQCRLLDRPPGARNHCCRFRRRDRPRSVSSDRPAARTPRSGRLPRDGRRAATARPWWRCRSAATVTGDEGGTLAGATGRRARVGRCRPERTLPPARLERRGVAARLSCSMSERPAVARSRGCPGRSSPAPCSAATGAERCSRSRARRNPPALGARRGQRRHGRR